MITQSDKLAIFEAMDEIEDIARRHNQFLQDHMNLSETQLEQSRQWDKQQKTIGKDALGKVINRQRDAISAALYLMRAGKPESARAILESV